MRHCLYHCFDSFLSQNVKILQVLKMPKGKKLTPEVVQDATVHSVQIGFVFREQPEIKWLPHVSQLTGVEPMPLAG